MAKGKLVHCLFLVCLFSFSALCSLGPCTNLTESPESDIEFLTLNMHSLYSDVIDFFQHEVPKQCNLHFVDPSKITPRGGIKDKNFVWVMYSGDSVLHDVFVTVAQGFSQYNPAMRPEDEDTAIGGHLGPVSDKAFMPHLYDQGYPVEVLFCCKARTKIPEGDNSDAGGCVIAGHRRPFRDEDIPPELEMFLFNDMSSYIESFVQPLYHPHPFKCVSFRWAKNFDQLKDVLKHFSKKDKFYPDAYIMNQAVHTFGSLKDKEIKNYLGNIQSITSRMLRTQKKVKFLMHSGSSFKHHKQENNENMKHFNELVSSTISSMEGWTYLDFWQHDRQLTETDGCKRDDGVHFERICNYQAVVSQWDLNWLDYFNITGQARDEM